MNYDYEFLEKNYNFSELKSILISLNGVPGTKSKRMVIEEIIKLQIGEKIPARTNRGRPRNNSRLNTYNMVALCGENATARDHVPFFDHGDFVSGVFEPVVDGSGVIFVKNYASSAFDVFVSAAIAKKYRLRKGDFIEGKVSKTVSKKSYELIDVQSINERAPGECGFVAFEDLTATFPDKQLVLGSSDQTALRYVDLFAPIGRGQRCLVIAQPSEGRTKFLKFLAQSLENNYPDIHLMLFLISQRPEEISDFKNSLKSEVISSNFENTHEYNVKLSELVLCRAKRLVEDGRDVVLIVDSINALCRAHGFIGSCGDAQVCDSAQLALVQPKRFFNSARNTERGSLSIIGAVNSGRLCQYDETVLEEFRNASNSEIFLDDDFSADYLTPTVDALRSRTRYSEILLGEKDRSFAIRIKRFLAESDQNEKIIRDAFEKNKTKEGFIQKVEKLIKP